MAKLTRRAVTLVLASLLLPACSATRGTEAPAAYLSPTGWQAVENTLPQGSFSDYAAAVRTEIDRFRIPFNPENAAQEANWAAPVELQPNSHCGDAVEGIAILVHGLSDTAFAMRDVAMSPRH